MAALLDADQQAEFPGSKATIIRPQRRTPNQSASDPGQGES
jgi:hypothetical protein